MFSYSASVYHLKALQLFLKIRAQVFNYRAEYLHHVRSHESNCEITSRKIEKALNIAPFYGKTKKNTSEKLTMTETKKRMDEVSLLQTC